MARLGFAVDMLCARWSPQRSLCPCCESRLHRRLQRKRFLIEARKSTVVPGGRVLDFGCSWGYSLVQWKAAGYDAVGFEWARDRARFGHADHVMKHLTLLRQPLDLFARLLRPGGALLFYVPNGGGMPARRHGTGWRALIGESHTVALTAEWCNRNLPAHGFSAHCFSGDRISTGSSLIDDEELASLARRC